MRPLILPWPPSTNRYYRYVEGRILISDAGRRYRRLVGQAVIAARPLPTFSDLDRLSVTVAAYPPDRRPRDLDNLLKCLLDALQHAGLFLNDSQIDVLMVGRGAVRKGGEVQVRVGKLAGQSGDCYLPGGSTI